MRRTLTAALLVTSLLAVATPVLAGGFATVRLDEPPGDVVAGATWRLGFTVRQHDVTPTNDVTPVLRARHMETGEEITASAEQEGPVGHFVLEVTFPASGAWKWAIQPQPFEETSFEPLMVVDSIAAVTGLQASIHNGGCQDLGGVAFALGEIASQETNVKSSQTPVSMVAMTVDTPLQNLLSSDHAISVTSPERTSAPLVCGDITDLAATPNADRAELVLGLQGSDRTRNVGVAVLRPTGERTTVTLYLLDVSQPISAPVASATTTVEIVGGETEEWAFRPFSVTIAPGGTVAWVNKSDMVHTITSEDLHFADSGLVEPGQTFEQTFIEPGTYRYRCGPHPWMEGVIVVE
jgi:plastocyanin